MPLRNALVGIGLFVFTSWVATASAWAAPGGGPPGWGHQPRPDGGPGRFLEAHADQLGLDADTREAIRGIAEESRRDAEALHAEIRDARERLHALLSEERVEEKEVMAAVDALGDRETALHRHQIAAMLRVRARLTPEQRRELLRMREERHAEHEHFRSMLLDALDACAKDAERLCDDPGPRALGCLHDQFAALSGPCAEALESLPPPPHARRRGTGPSGRPAH